MSDPSADIIQQALQKHMAPAELQVLAAGAADVAQGAKLSDEDVKRIAEAVSARMFERFSKDIPAASKEKWKAKIGKLTYDMTVSLASSGLFSLLGYLLHVYGYFDSGDQEILERKRRRERAMERLAQRVQANRRAAFDKVVENPFLNLEIGVALQKRIAADPTIAETERDIVTSRLAKLGGKAQSDPSPPRVALDNEVASALAGMLFSALKHDVGERLGEPEIYD